MIKVYGSSDDLIEVEGDISEEFYASNDKPNILAVSNGIVLDVSYTSLGMWKISILKNPFEDNPLVQSRLIHVANDPEGNYSDVFFYSGQIDWITYGHEWKQR